MIAIQKELQKFGIEAVVSKYNLIYKDYGHKFLLKYSQIDSIEFKAVQAVRECRGIILDKNTFQVYSLPFVRFFNYGEDEADTLDFKSIEVFKKEDGSLISVYYDFVKEEWCVQTSGSAEGESLVGIHNMTFKELFLKTANLDFNRLVKGLNYVFELCCIENKIVEHHSSNYVSLLTVRSTINLSTNYGELSRSEVEVIGEYLNVRVVPSYEFNSFDDVLEKIQTLPDTREGFVIMDKFYKRIKVKNPKYVMLHHLKSTLSLENLVNVVLDQEQDEVISYFPEYKELLDEYTKKFEDLKIELYKVDKEIEAKFSYEEKDKKNVAIFLNSEKKHLSLFHSIFFNKFNTQEVLDLDKKFKEMKDKNISRFKRYVK